MSQDSVHIPGSTGGQQFVAGEAEIRNAKSSTVIPFLQKGNWEMSRNYSRDGASITSLENLFQLHHPHRKECLLYIESKFFSLKRITNNSQGLEMLASRKSKKENNLQG